MRLSYDEVIDILDLKYIPTKKQVNPQTQVFTKWLI